MMMASERTTLLGQMLKLEDEELKIALASGSSMIICGGIIDLMLGLMALCSPIAATYASYSLVTALFYVVSIISSFFFVLFFVHHMLCPKTDTVAPLYRLPSFI